MIRRQVARATGAVFAAAVLMAAVVMSVDWSPTALRDPARMLLLGPRESFALASVEDPPVFSAVELVLFFLAGTSFVAAGTYLWSTRPRDLVGPLFVLAGLLWIVGGIRRSSDPVLFTLGAVATNFYLPVLIAVLLGFPTGRLQSRGERWCVVACWATAVFGVSAEWMFFDPRAAPATHPSTSVNLLLVRHDPAVYDIVALTVGAVTFAIGIVLIGVGIRRWRSGTTAYRAGFAPVLFSATIGALTAFWLLLTAVRFPGSQHGATLNLRYVPIVLVPIAVVYGVVRYRMARAAVGAAMVEIGSAPLGAGFVDALQRALHDPSLVLLTYSADRGGYVDDDGNEQVLPLEPGPRAVSILERDGVRAGALVYDASLQTEPELLAAVRSATTLALNHERLRHELQAQLVEVQRSRKRIVATGDAQRRRLERDLHDGAQQRLVAAALLLRRAQRTPDDRTHRELLSEGAEELDRALDELRELARGVYPPVLTERGLAAALTCLAERAPMAVEVRSTLSRRPPVSTELAAYFIVAEGIANASKHSGADLVEVRLDEVDLNLRILVSDDGCGSATQPSAGGLAGLRDRASALGGELLIDSPPGRGTTLVVTLPFVPEDTS